EAMPRPADAVGVRSWVVDSARESFRKRARPPHDPEVLLDQPGPLAAVKAAVEKAAVDKTAVEKAAEAVPGDRGAAVVQATIGTSPARGVAGAPSEQYVQGSALAAGFDMPIRGRRCRAALSDLNAACKLCLSAAWPAEGEQQYRREGDPGSPGTP